ncbi:MAG: DNA-binding protein, partial [Gammaproteobacteria bacterium]
MKDWLTAREIAGASLRDLPSTKRGVTMLAEREGWNDHPTYVRRRAGRGGGLEYNFRLLPSIAQIEWARRHMTVSLPEDMRALAAAEDEPASAPATLTERAQRERDARLAIVASFEAWSRGLSLTFVSRV